MCDVAVVGAGIAGLTAAWHLTAPPTLSSSRRRRARAAGFAPRTAASTGSTSPPTSFPRRTLTSAGSWEQSGSRPSPSPGTGMGAYLNGRLVATGRPATYPLRLRTSTAGRLSLLRAGLKIRRGVAEFRRLAEPRPGETASARRSRLLAYRDGETFASFLGDLHPDADELLRAAVNRVSAEPEDLSAGAGITQFAATFSGRASLYNRNLVGGTGVLVTALEQALDGKLVKNARVTRVANADGGATLTVEHDGTDVEVSASAIVVATPAYVTRAIVNGLPEPLARALGSIHYGPYVVAALLTTESRPMPWDDLYAAVVGGSSFNMFFNTANVLRRHGGRKPGGTLMVYGSASRGARLLDLSDDAVTDRFTRELATVFPETNGIVKEVIVQRWEQGIPLLIAGAQPASSHARAAARPDLPRRRLPGRTGWDGYSRDERRGGGHCGRRSARSAV